MGMAKSNEYGIDADLDPRSFEAAVQWRAVREAERVVERAAHGPSSMERFTTGLFGQLRQAIEDERSAS